ncbi:Ubiquitin carboxyl-terminal hydrolase 48 [Didymosphaeria variabile]|uniref:Ubiquitin carboxyl-terminal hydrolase 48 n=1 Tax=Didymosphaeria variabile TaxID=1932322 RepID=A0A9W8XDD7_9PLEO|nr:Ubiquitin carboxyl-terminal hydrolase 48 [Didymosphaeria variabile]KAJ4347860.1 Ubiquitin carboxyl-terminal hydrolase 48 [Didymosphaeria variabile]
MKDLKRAAFVEQEFQPYAQADASAFVEWLLRKLFEIHGNVNFEWITQFEALFRILTVPFDTCRVCAIVNEAAVEAATGLTINVRPNDNTVDEAFQNFIENDTDAEYQCRSKTCKGANRFKERRWAVRAAPRILRVTLNIFAYDVNAQYVRKIMHALTIGEILDLTQYQECTVVPLRYRLSAVIPHRGNSADAGHYIANVRSQGPNPLYNINDTRVESISGAQFTSNPHLLRGGQSARFQAYILTYIRDEAPLEQHLESTNKMVATDLKIDRGKKPVV